MKVTPEQLEKAVFAASGKWCAGLNSWEHAIAAAMQPVDGDVVPLSDCPIGLFKSVSTGTLCLKTEYGLDSYIIESGERFWGGTSSQDTLADVKVIPVAMASRPDALAIRAQAFAERDAQWGRALIALSLIHISFSSLAIRLSAIKELSATKPLSGGYWRA